MRRPIVALFDEYRPEVVAAIARASGRDFELVFAESQDRAQQADAVRDAAALIVGFAPVDAELIASAPNLRIIQKAGVGVDKIDLAAAAERNVAVSRAAGTNAAPVADLTVLFILALQRHLLWADASLRRGEWVRSEMRARATHLQGRNIGIVGFGKVGMEVARRLRGFGATIRYADVRRVDQGTEDSLGASWMDLDALVAWADVVTLHASDAGGPIMTQKRFESMKTTALLINTARGSLVDEDALYRALSNGRIAGAGLDVFATEPLQPSSPLLRLDNVVVTPHVGASVIDNVENVMSHCFHNIRSFFSGEALPDADVVVGTVYGYSK